MCTKSPLLSTNLNRSEIQFYRFKRRQRNQSLGSTEESGDVQECVSKSYLTHHWSVRSYMFSFIFEPHHQKREKNEKKKEKREEKEKKRKKTK